MPPKKTTKKATAKKAAPKKVVREPKKDVISKHQTHGKDTGSAQVQVAVLTKKITDLTDHLKDHPKDKHSRRGLIGMVGKRRKLLKYLQMTSASAYAKLTQALNLRK